jgi:hypothetical protein
MDEEKRDRRMDYAEERETFAEDRMEEEMRDPGREYSDEPEALTEDPMDEETVERPREYRDGTDSFIEEATDEDHGRPEQAARARSEELHERERPSMERELVPLLDESEAQEFRTRWQDIQTDFVDDPRQSVESADELVARVINSITENFARERNSLEDHWNRGEEASTEDLRIAIKRYRSFFNRLLTLETMGTED